ncbi:glycerophosphodiester phosphodiesterase family protein [Lacibacter sp. MH-610]|uniref:glycerophosphodiester phosphodiesterase family protein n=1 Tax=Lacibacter sp. MH-610 TaxID=3020883 RepID=UPI0038922286
MRFLLLLIFMSCVQGKKLANPPAKVEGFDKQGHRGCRGLMPENTIAAMLYALELGVTTLEMDVVITKDKKVILSHEPFFNHEISTPRFGIYVNAQITQQNEREWNIYQMNYSDVKKIDVGLKPHPRFLQQKKTAAYKPLLSDLLDSVQQYMMMAKRHLPFFNIETKSMPATDDVFHPKPAEFVELLMTVVKEKEIEDRVIIQSFDFRTLQYLHQKYPHIKTAMLIEDFDKRGIEKQIEALGFQPAIYSPHFSLVNEKLLAYCHQRTIKVIPWTVNKKEEIERLKKMGVDGIITDYPDLF